MSTVLWVIISVALIFFTVGFLMLVLSLVPAIFQFKSLLLDLEKTSTEARDLAVKLKSLSQKVDRDIDKVDQILESTKESVATVNESLKFINMSVLKQTAGLLALIPAIRFGWKLIKKMRRR